jgi:hypothetical protein
VPYIVDFTLQSWTNKGVICWSIAATEVSASDWANFENDKGLLNLENPRGKKENRTSQKQTAPATVAQIPPKKAHSFNTQCVLGQRVKMLSRNSNMHIVQNRWNSFCPFNRFKLIQTDSKFFPKRLPNYISKRRPLKERLNTEHLQNKDWLFFKNISFELFPLIQLGTLHH